MNYVYLVFNPRETYYHPIAFAEKYDALAFAQKVWEVRVRQEDLDFTEEYPFPYDYFSNALDEHNEASGYDEMIIIKKCKIY